MLRDNKNGFDKRKRNAMIFCELSLFEVQHDKT